MNATELSALLLLTTAASFTPGPNTTLSTALAANFGLRRSLTFVCAVAGRLGAVVQPVRWRGGGFGPGRAGFAPRRPGVGCGVFVVAGDGLM